MTKPSKLPAGQFPGATNRYEDFVVIHMQQTLNIHSTVRILWGVDKFGLMNLGQLPVMAQILYLGI